MQLVKGLVIRSQSGFYTVQVGDEQIVCQVRGRLKQGPRIGDILAVGDWVQVAQLDDKSGMIESVETRSRMLSRMAPTPKGEYQQIIVSNPDQVVFVFACAEPAPHLRMLDRLIIAAEMQHIPVVIVSNKIELVGLDQAMELFGVYRGIGYKVIFTSVKTGKGIGKLQECLSGKVSVMAGPSGVGKTSLLNLIQPDLGLAIRRVSQATLKGRHTTVVREMFPLNRGGYVTDTPGLKAFALWDLEPEEIDGYFPEMRNLVKDCMYNDCTHIHETDCAIRNAVENGEISPERYDSYIRLRLGEE